jgi:hypothetical protein
MVSKIPVYGLFSKLLHFAGTKIKKIKKIKINRLFSKRETIAETKTLFKPF